MALTNLPKSGRPLYIGVFCSPQNKIFSFQKKENVQNYLAFFWGRYIFCVNLFQLFLLKYMISVVTGAKQAGLECLSESLRICACPFYIPCHHVLKQYKLELPKSSGAQVLTQEFLNFLRSWRE